MSRTEGLLDLLSTCLLVMEFHSDVILCSNLGNKSSDMGKCLCWLHSACKIYDLK